MPITGELEPDLKSWLNGRGFSPLAVVVRRDSDGADLALLYDDFSKRQILHLLLQAANSIAEEVKEQEP